MRLSSNVLFFCVLLAFVSCNSEPSSSQANNTDQASSTQEISTQTEAPIAEAKVEMPAEIPSESESSTPKIEEPKLAAKKEAKPKSEIAVKPKSTSKSVEDIIEKAVQTKPIATPKPSAPKTEKPTTTVNATPKPASPKEKAPIASKPNHKNFGSLLKKHVSSSGNVNYKALKADHGTLQKYLAELAKETPKSSWSRNEKLAYWINAYNAFTIDLILNNYPMSKITDLDGGSPWKVSRIDLGGKKYSLDQIENKIIRPQFKDARIHFAVNCAAKSCPTLLNDAFYANSLDRQLESQTKKFINNSAFNKIESGAYSVSKIFEWYAEDFGDLVGYLNKYSKVQIEPAAKATFIDYDWTLNGN